MFSKINKTKEITNTNNTKNDLKNNILSPYSCKIWKWVTQQIWICYPLDDYNVLFKFCILSDSEQSVGTTKARIWYYGTGGWCQQGIQILIRCCLHWRCWWWVPWWHGIQIRPFLPHWACPMCWRRGRRGANRDQHTEHWTQNTQTAIHSWTQHTRNKYGSKTQLRHQQKMPQHYSCQHPRLTN